MASWHVVASGDSDDPEHHHRLVDDLRRLFAKPEYGTGSSEFASAHTTAMNLQDLPDPDAAVEATAPASGAGVPETRAGDLDQEPRE